MMKTVDSRNFLKTLSYRVKTNTYVAYMLKLISLTVTNFEKIASYVDDPVFFICVQNYSILSIIITEFNAINFLVLNREPYPEPCEISKMEHSVKIINYVYIFDRVLNTPLI